MTKDKVFSTKELSKMWDTYDEIIHAYIKLDRIKQIEKMFDDISEQIVLSPCSTRYHGNYEGGLLEHSIDAIGSTLYVRKYFVKMGLEMDRIPTKESCVFCAAFHDLGKIGEVDNDYYIPETSDWHREKLNQQYKRSKEVINLHHSDGSVYLLNKYNIDMSRAEHQAIISHDGAYHPKNAPYKHKVELLSRILREGDMLAFILQSRKQFKDKELR